MVEASDIQHKGHWNRIVEEKGMPPFCSNMAGYHHKEFEAEVKGPNLPDKYFFSIA